MRQKLDIETALHELNLNNNLITDNVIDTLVEAIRKISLRCSQIDGNTTPVDTDIATTIKYVVQNANAGVENSKKLESLMADFDKSINIQNRACLKYKGSDAPDTQQINFEHCCPDYIEINNNLNEIIKLNNKLEHKISELMKENQKLQNEKIAAIDSKNVLVKTINDINNGDSKIEKSDYTCSTPVKSDLAEQMTSNLSDIKVKSEENLYETTAVHIKKACTPEIVILENKYTLLNGKFEAVMQNHNEILIKNEKLQQEVVDLFKRAEDGQKHETEAKYFEAKYKMAKNKYLENDDLKNAQIDNLKKIIENYKTNGVLDSKVDQKIKDVRNEYEGKLEKMKMKMKQLYTEEMAKIHSSKEKEETEKVQALCQQYKEKIHSYEQHVADLSKQLWEIGEKLIAEQNRNVKLGKEISLLHEQNHRFETGIRNTREEYRPKSVNDRRDSFQRSTLPRDHKTNTNIGNNYMDIIEETTTTTRRSVKPVPVSSALHMEDEEGEMFNNTYLTDLKSGLCSVPNVSNRGSMLSQISMDQPGSSHRIGELQWRNSMCLPHLKSSYAAETQFVDCKEEEIKAIGYNLDSSSTTLLTGEKSSSRVAKERGGTTYKKPGPPTPSKNGGRLSLQGNELPRDVLKEQNDNKTVKKGKATTPSRLKSMLMGGLKGNQNVNKDSSENEQSTPKKRLSIFKRPR